MIEKYAAYLFLGVIAGAILFEGWLSYRRWSTRRAINHYLDWKDEP